MDKGKGGDNWGCGRPLPKHTMKGVGALPGKAKGKGKGKDTGKDPDKGAGGKRAGGKDKDKCETAAWVERHFQELIGRLADEIEACQSPP